MGRFCLNCGHPIGAPAPAVPQASAPRTAAPAVVEAPPETAPPAEPEPEAEAEPDPEPEVSEAPPAAVPVQAADATPLPPAPVMPPSREPRFRLRGRPAATAREDRPTPAPAAGADPEWDPELDLLPYHEVDDLEPEAPLTGRAWIFWVVGALALIALVLVLLRVFESEPVDDTATDQSSGQSSTAPDTSPGAAEEAAPEEGDSSESPQGVGKRLDLADTATFAAPGTAPPTQDFDGNLVAYEASQMGDGSPATTWRTAGDASGQSITITLAQAGVVSRVGLVNGYAKKVAGVDWYPNNRRILSATWSFDDGSSVEQTFAERPAMQLLKVPPVETSTVTLTITSVTPPGAGPLGRDYTAISEVTLVGRNAA